MHSKPAIGRETLSTFLLIASSSVSLFSGVLMMAGHTPFRPDDPVLKKVASLYPHNEGVWRAVHILAADCACSRGVAEYLQHRGSLKGLEESVVFLGSEPALETRLQIAKFKVRTMSPEEAATRYGLHGAPWLVFISPQNDLRYSGGYSPERSGRGGYQDARIWEALRSGRTVQPLPAYGCAIGRKLQRIIDPLGLKYGSGLGS